MGLAPGALARIHFSPQPDMTKPSFWMRAAARTHRQRVMTIRALASIGLLALAGGARADEPLAAQPLAGTATLRSMRADGPWTDLLALSQAEPGHASPNAAAAGPDAVLAPPPKPALFTGSDAHKYLGLGTVVLVGLTAATAPGEGCEHNCTGKTQRQTSGTTHTRLARATAAMAAATVTSGLLVHWDDFHLKDGLSDPDNQHVLLGLAGSILMLYAVNKSMHSTVPTQHAVFAEVGGAAMAVAIKLTW